MDILHFQTLGIISGMAWKGEDDTKDKIYKKKLFSFSNNS